MRQCKQIDGKKILTVKKLIITVNYWEHFILQQDDIPDSDDHQFALVNGDENEFGYVSINELNQFRLTDTVDLNDCLPPVGYQWL